MNTRDVLEKTGAELLSESDQSVRLSLGKFIREFNRREWTVRMSGQVQTFDEYVREKYAHEEEFGTGFVVEDRAVPYFHPNRSFHDEIIWLNDTLFYDPEVSFANKLLNSAIVKFYGPSRTLNIITGTASDLPYLRKTGAQYIDFKRLRLDVDYLYDLMYNIEVAKSNKEQIWGTTELRSSLQTEAGRYARLEETVVEKRGVKNPLTNEWVIARGSHDRERKMRTSDMILWIASMAEPLEKFYLNRPTMEESFTRLTEYRGIGNYYGYHFSSNLARMPQIGSKSLIEAPATAHKFKSLKTQLPELTHGNLDENADYVVAGPGACATLKRLWPSAPINPKTTMKMILSIRDDQERFFGIESDEAKMHLREASELGQFTTFGVEIACCQYSVFERLRSDKSMALNRSRAPISKEIGKSASDGLEKFF